MNDQICRARDVGREVLRPSPRDLEHGLELHEASLVIESYGFSPRGAVDTGRVDALITAGASDFELRENTEEMLLTSPADDPQLAREYQVAFTAAGVDCVLQNAGEEGQSALQLLKRLGNFTYLTDRLATFMQRATTPDDILRARQNGKRSLYLTGNGVPLRQDWRDTVDELRYIRTFFQLGVRMMHLTYNRRNMLGDGCAEKTNTGLSDFGEAAVHEMNKIGVIIDVAHSGWQTCIDTAETSTQPIVASHTGVHALNSHCRCKTDEVLQAIANTGGTIGICCIPAFLGGSGDLNALLDHIDYLARLVGTDHITIGSDRAYTPSRKAGQPALSTIRKIRPRFEFFWPPDDELHNNRWKQEPMQKSLAWTNWPLFTVGMVKRGYTDVDIQKILGGNILRVAQAVFPHRAAQETL